MKYLYIFIMVLSFPAYPKLKICDQSNYKEFIDNIEKTNKLIKRTGKGCYLINAVLTRADLRGANLTNADLTGADLTGADLTNADLTEAYLIGTIHNQNTKWPEGYTRQSKVFNPFVLF